MAKFLFVFLAAVLFAPASQAAVVDGRFTVVLTQEEAAGLDIRAATKYALPMLWRRVVPVAMQEKAKTLQAATSLVLQFKPMKHGAKLVFNPQQVSDYLRRNGIKMIPEPPHWNLSVQLKDVTENDDELSRDLLDYGHSIADAFGYNISQRGKKLQLVFSTAFDSDDESLLHVDILGDFSSTLLSQTDIRAEGDTSYQLQGFLERILLEIRDAYSSGLPVFTESFSDVLLTIEVEQSLATQVMFEQALKRNPAVIRLLPVLLQKSQRQYQMRLRDGNDAWLGAWFASYGLTAVRAADGSAAWLVQ